MNVSTLDSPLGPVWVTVNADGEVVQVGFGHPAEPALPSSASDAAADQLREYFAHERTAFDLPLAPRGTAFQQRVWAALAEIPYGYTDSYGRIAARIGHPKASRAVGLANRNNPIAIVVPCHRVVGASGTLVGYAGGLERKRWLLALEGVGAPTLV